MQFSHGLLYDMAKAVVKDLRGGTSHLVFTGLIIPLLFIGWWWHQTDLNHPTGITNATKVIDLQLKLTSDGGRQEDKGQVYIFPQSVSTYIIPAKDQLSEALLSTDLELYEKNKGRIVATRDQLSITTPIGESRMPVAVVVPGVISDHILVNGVSRKIEDLRPTPDIVFSLIVWLSFAIVFCFSAFISSDIIESAN